MRTAVNCCAPLPELSAIDLTLLASSLTAASTAAGSCAGSSGPGSATDAPSALFVFVSLPSFEGGVSVVAVASTRFCVVCAAFTARSSIARERGAILPPTRITAVPIEHA